MHKKLLFVLPILLLILSTGQVAKAELLAHYPLDGSTIDATGNGNDGIPVGDPTYVPGKNGQAISLDGSTQWVDCGNPAMLNLTEQITLAAWVNPTNFNNSSYQVIVSKGDRCYTIQHHNSNRIEFMIYSGGWRTVQQAPADGIASMNNNWHHIAGTFDGTQMVMYFDGEVVGTTALTGTITASGSNVFIGANSDNAGRAYAGLIDDVMIFDTALTQEEVQALMAGIAYGEASKPNPEDGAIDVPLDVVMSWEAGQYANTHNVYFGTDFDDVNTAGIADAVSAGQSDLSYDPGGLEYGTTYFWRIDEVNAPPTQGTVFKGDTWSFTTELYAYPVGTDRIGAFASSSTADRGPEKTADLSGIVDAVSVYHLDAAHTTDTTSAWLSDEADAGPVWIQYDFDKPYMMDSAMIWNFNGYSILTVVGIQDVTVEYQGVDDAWVTLGDVQLNEATGYNDYMAGNTIDFAGATAKAVKLTANSNFTGGFLPMYGLSEVLFLQVPVYASNPNPANGAADVAIDAELTWTAGRGADSHTVYLSDDQTAVAAGTAAASTVSDASLITNSLLGTTYYWRVDEIIGGSTWANTGAADIWNYTTADAVVVDDFEAYNDEDPDGNFSFPFAIFSTWVDGLGIAANGATIGYLTTPSMETGTSHGGSQSAPFQYDNTTVAYSEVTVDPADLAIGRNWNVGGATTLVIWFYGNTANDSALDQLYVKVGGNKLVYGGDAAAISTAAWTQWVIDLAALGVNQNNVSSLAIGMERIGAAGGAGTVLIDDILLYRVAP